MAVDPHLLENLVCPACREPLTPVDADRDMKCGLKCGRCRRVYPILDDIPVMLIGEATTADD
jgi:hypothetical protein